MKKLLILSALLSTSCGTTTKVEKPKTEKKVEIKKTKEDLFFEIVNTLDVPKAWKQRYRKEYSKTISILVEKEQGLKTLFKKFLEKNNKYLRFVALEKEFEFKVVPTSTKKKKMLSEMNSFFKVYDERDEAGFELETEVKRWASRNDWTDRQEELFQKIFYDANFVSETKAMYQLKNELEK